MFIYSSSEILVHSFKCFSVTKKEKHFSLYKWCVSQKQKLLNFESVHRDLSFPFLGQ